MKLIRLPVKILFSFCLVLILCGLGGSGVNSRVFGQSLTTTVSTSRMTAGKLKEQFVDVEDLKLHYIETGSGRPVVLLHGNAGSARDFQFGTLGVMAGNYRTIAFDLPGHGASERKAKMMTIEEQAKVLHRALAELGIKKPIIVGHSWGGSVALAYAMQYPDDVGGLVLLAPAAYPDPSGQSKFTALLDLPLLGDLCFAVMKPIVSLKILKSELETAFYPDTVPPEYFKAAKAEWLSKKQIKNFLHDDQVLNQSLQKMSSRYGNLRMPVVIVTGDSDRMVLPQENAYLLHEKITQSELIILPRAGHQIPEMHPEAVLQAVRTSMTNANSFTLTAANQSKNN